MHQLVPGFILENYAARTMRGAFYAAGMFVDISGFSSMTDTLMQHGSHGAEVLAGVIRAAFSPLMRVVFEQGGFVVNQAGDSFTALFPANDEADLIPPTVRALAAARRVQEHAAAQPTFETPYGSFTISVKVGLASGDCQWQILISKTEERAVYYFRGSVIDRCVEAEHQAGPGEIILDESISTTANDVGFSGQMEVEPRGEFYRLRGIKEELPPPVTQPVIGKDSDAYLDLACRFYPESVLTSTINGEFRQLVTMFISLPTVRQETQLEIFMDTFFELQEHYGGLLSRLSFGDKGSHLYIFWGAPTAHENDLARALNFILELQARTEIPVHGGITCRLAHIGFIGGELAEEYTGYGRGVNLAARLMTAAARGEIWVDAPVARGAGSGFAFEPLGLKTFKGFAQPQEVWALLERNEQAELIYDGSLVGRKDELDTLARFAQPVFAGEYGGALVVWGEPGVGKSRLVHDFLDQIEPSNRVGVQVFLGQCDEILRQSLNPFRYWLKNYFDQSDQQSDARNKRSFNRRLDELIAATQDARLAGELDRTRSCLGALVGLEWPDSLYQQLDAQGRFENTLLGLVALIQTESRRAPVIFFLEDAHWLDDDSKSFLSRLLRFLSGDSLGQYPVAIIATARFEGTGLPLETFPYQEIRLGELDRAALASLAANRLGGPVATALLNLLFERSEGNPFFADQILRYLQEEGKLVQRDGEWQVEQPRDPGEQRPPALIPENVQAVLVARLDRLAEEVRQVVQAAAVLGREFEIRLLARMLKEDNDLPDKVEKAEQADVWAAVNEMRYIFRHALLRDAAYTMQLQARRKELHAIAMEALVQIYLPTADLPPGDPDTIRSAAPHYSELAYHAEQAGLKKKAFEYLIKAAEAARDAYQNNDAVDFYSRAIALIDAGTSGERLEDLYIECGRVLERTGRFEQALAGYQKLAAIAQERHDRGMELATLMAQSVIFSIETSVQDRGKGVQIAQQALALARDLKDRAAEAYTLNHLALANLFLSQDPTISLPYSEQAIALARELNLPELLARVLTSSVGTYIFALGQFEIGQTRAAEVIRICQEMGKPHWAGEALQSSALGYLLAGSYPQAIERVEAADQVNKMIGSAWGQAFCAQELATICWDQGEYSQAMDQTERAIRLGDESGYLMGRIMCRGLLGMMYSHMGLIPEALSACQKGLAISESKDQAFMAQVLASLAWVYTLQGDLPRAEETIRQAWQALERRISFPIEPNVVAIVDGIVAEAAQDWSRLQSSAERALAMVTRMNNRLFSVDARYLLGRALLEQGRTGEARGILEQALTDAEEIGVRRMRWRVLAALAQCEADDAQRQQQLARARETVLSIADQIQKPEWREPFLKQTDVKKVLLKPGQ